MQRRRRGQQNIPSPIKSYEGSFSYQQNSNQGDYQQVSQIEQSFPEQTFKGYVNEPQDSGTMLWNKNKPSDNSYITYTEPQYAQYIEPDEQVYDDDYDDDYDPEEDKEYQMELKRERWKLVYFFINLCGAIFGLLMIFLLIAVAYNMIAWVLSDLLKIFSFLGVR